MLSQYKSVNEVVAAINEEAPSIEFVEGVPIRIALHISFQDTTGDSALLNGEMENLKYGMVNNTL